VAVERLKAAIEAWREADAKAKAAEAALAGVMDAAFNRRIVGVPDDLVRTASRLRADANERLKEAVAAMRPGSDPGTQPPNS
jgi:hypothetical protein